MKIDFTTNKFIFDVLKLFKWKEEVGIFSSNTIPEELKTERNFTIICNLSRADEKGTHFVAVIRRGDQLLYLDSLALYIDLNADIETFINSCNVKSVIKLSTPIQADDSWYCGYFTIFFALYFNPLAKVKEVEKFSSKDLRKNDCICIENIVSYLNELKN